MTYVLIEALGNDCSETYTRSKWLLGTTGAAQCLLSGWVDKTGMHTAIASCPGPTGKYYRVGIGYWTSVSDRVDGKKELVDVDGFSVVVLKIVHSIKEPK